MFEWPVASGNLGGWPGLCAASRHAGCPALGSHHLLTADCGPQPLQDAPVMAWAPLPGATDVHVSDVLSGCPSGTSTTQGYPQPSLLLETSPHLLLGLRMNPRLVLATPSCPAHWQMLSALLQPTQDPGTPTPVLSRPQRLPWALATLLVGLVLMVSIVCPSWRAKGPWNHTQPPLSSPCVPTLQPPSSTRVPRAPRVQATGCPPRLPAAKPPGPALGQGLSA